MPRVLLCAFLASAALPAQEAKLTVSGDIPKPLTLTIIDLAAMPRSTAVFEEHGTRTTYQGVLLYDILRRAGAPLDKELRGKAIASYVLAEARDGYQVVYTLTELDPAFADNKIIVADSTGGNPLGETQGPLRIVVPNEKMGARSIRMLQRITVVRLRK
jgi:DMSO/TMAO reductase YedYZ molybdopterin-dependent catalytic subunit